MPHRSFNLTATFWAPSGFYQRYVPKDWQRVRRSHRRDSDWTGLLRRYFRRIRSVQRALGFNLSHMAEFNTTIWENRRQYYLVVNPSRDERGMFFVCYRHADAFLNTHWPQVMLREKHQLMRNHILQNMQGTLTERLDNDKLTHDLLEQISALLLNVHQAMQFNNRQMTRILYTLLTDKPQQDGTSKARTEALLFLWQLRGETEIEQIEPEDTPPPVIIPPTNGAQTPLWCG